VALPSRFRPHTVAKIRILPTCTPSRGQTADVDATNPEPPFEDRALIEIVADVWRSFFELDTVDTLSADAGPPPATAVTSAVAFNGAWDGHLRITAPVGPAAEIAAFMLALEPDDVTEQDMADSLGELVNIIGGNVRGHLPQPNQLGLPVVTVGGRDALRFPASRPAMVVIVGWKGEPIEFCLLRAVPRRERVGAAS
jgi:chemotaxis protein CheX